MIYRLERIFFYLLILCIPVQLGRHFWPSFSYVSGIRLDYLSPTLYLTDILILLLLVFYCASEFFNNSKRKVHSKKNVSFFLLPVFIFTLLLGFFLAKSIGAHFLGVIKLLEFAFLAYYIAKRFKKTDIGLLVDSLAIGAVYSSVIAIVQFYIQGSIGSLAYFLGERFYSPGSIGIALMNINGQQMLRPYGTFPHPNILAFFLLFAIMFISLRLPFEKKIYEKLFLITALIISIFALSLTFARVTLFCFVVFCFFVLFKYLLKRKLSTVIPIFFLILFFVCFYLFVYSQRFFALGYLLSDLNDRVSVLIISFNVLKDNFLFGIGLNNFYYHEINYQKILSPTFLQPVHNIYVVILLQLGIVGSILPFLFIVRTIKKVAASIKVKDQELKHFFLSVFFVFLSALFIGFFDHFFLTLQQGQILYSLIFGLSWVKLKS